ncbi:hypothetical protein AB1N83_012944 [Pleurotus pulmonarius]
MIHALILLSLCLMTQPDRASALEPFEGAKAEPIRLHRSHSIAPSRLCVPGAKGTDSRVEPGGYVGGERRGRDFDVRRETREGGVKAHDICSNDHNIDHHILHSPSPFLRFSARSHSDYRNAWNRQGSMETNTRTNAEI